MSGFERFGEVEQGAETEVDERGMSADERFFAGIRFAPDARRCHCYAWSVVIPGGYA